MFVFHMFQNLCVHLTFDFYCLASHMLSCTWSQHRKCLNMITDHEIANQPSAMFTCIIYFRLVPRPSFLFRGKGERG